MPDPEPPCVACLNRTSSSGLYRSQCVCCAASLILSAHPLREQAAALLEAQLRMPRSPSRAEILAKVAELLKERANER